MEDMEFLYFVFIRFRVSWLVVEIFDLFGEECEKFNLEVVVLVVILNSG